MMLMIPGIIPFKRAMVYLTGLIEIAVASGLLLPNTRLVTGWLLIILFMLVLPANINAAVKNIDHEKANARARGLFYLRFRIPVQLFFIAWIYFFTIRF